MTTKKMIVTNLTRRRTMTNSKKNFVKKTRNWMRKS